MERTLLHGRGVRCVGPGWGRVPPACHALTVTRAGHSCACATSTLMEVPPAASGGWMMMRTLSVCTLAGTGGEGGSGGRGGDGGARRRGGLGGVVLLQHR